MEKITMRSAKEIKDEIFHRLKYHLLEKVQNIIYDAIWFNHTMVTISQNSYLRVVGCDHTPTYIIDENNNLSVLFSDNGIFEEIKATLEASDYRVTKSHMNMYSNLEGKSMDMPVIIIEWEMV